MFSVMFVLFPVYATAIKAFFLSFPSLSSKGCWGEGVAVGMLRIFVARQSTDLIKWPDVPVCIRRRSVAPF